MKAKLVRIRHEWLWVGLLSFIALVWRFYWAYRGFFPFTWDFARDMLWVRKLTIDFEPMLVGAWGSLQGTFFGPLYFYMLAPVLLLFKGDPRSAVGMVTALTTALVPLAYLWGRQIRMMKAAIIWAVGFALLPWFSFVSLYSFPQHIIPLWYLGFLIVQWWFLTKPIVFHWFILWMFVGLGWNFEPVNVGWAVVISGVLGLLYLWKKPITLWAGFVVAALLGLVLSMAPNIIFDVRNDWIQLKGFYTLLTGTDTSYGDTIPLWFRFGDRFRLMSNLVADVLFLRNRWVFWSALGACSFYLYFKVRKGLVWQKISKNSMKLLSLVGIHAFGLYVYFLLFPKLLKDYYLYMIPVMVVVVVGIIIEELWVSKRIKPVWLMVFVLVWIGVLWGREFDRGVYRNQAQYYSAQKQVVDELYERAEGKPFKVYVYTPVVYDYPYQYLISWYGYNRYGYIPVDYSYLPNQPDYVYDKKRFDANKDRKTDYNLEKNYKTYLVREPTSEHQFYGRTSWLDNFPGSESIEPEYLPYGFELRIIEQTTLP